MANICSFNMVICGEKENIRAFLDAMQREGDIYMGRGAKINFGSDVDHGELALDAAYDSDEMRVEVFGSCKWSMETAFIFNVANMREQKETGEGIWYDKDGFITNHEFLTIYEACEKFHVNMEAYSTEPSCQFAEHIMYQDGMITEECEEYFEEYYDKSDYEDEEDPFAAWKEDNGIPDEITIDDLDDGWLITGGFEKDFSVYAPEENERDL